MTLSESAKILVMHFDAQLFTLKVKNTSKSYRFLGGGLPPHPTYNVCDSSAFWYRWLPLLRPARVLMALIEARKGPDGF